jgi:hypothetical protein
MLGCAILMPSSMGHGGAAPPSPKNGLGFKLSEKEDLVDTSDRARCAESELPTDTKESIANENSATSLALHTAIVRGKHWFMRTRHNQSQVRKTPSINACV